MESSVGSILKAGMIAEYERAKIMERSRRGKRHAARRGSVSVLCGAPYAHLLSDADNSLADTAQRAFAV